MHWKKLLFSILCSLLFLIIIGLKVDFGLVAQSLKGVKNFFWGIGIGALCAALLLQGLRWHLILSSQGIKVNFLSVCKATYYGHFFNTILMGPVTGDIFKSNLFAKRHGFPVLQILSSAWLDRLIAGVGSILFGVSVIAFTLLNSRTLDIELKLPSPSKVIGICALILGLIFILWKTKAFRRISFLVRLKQNFSEASRNLLHAKGKAALGVILGFFVQILLSSVMGWSVAAICVAETDWVKLLWVFPVISMLSCLPISFGGIGVRDGASILLLGTYGIHAQDAVAASCICLCTYMIIAIFGGVLAATEICKK